jgi:phosphoglycolate phosphatase
MVRPVINPIAQPAEPRTGLRHPDSVLFDLDGTLVDSRAAFVHSMNHALQAVGLPPRAAAELHGYLGPPIHEALTAHMHVPSELVDPVIAGYREHYAAHGVAETAVSPGIGELLERLHGRVRLAVATSKPEPTAAHMLHELGLDRFFEAICGPGPEAVNEPKAVTVGRTLETLAQRALVRRAVMVGDRLYDVVGARQQGVPTIGVLWGVGGEAELRTAGAAALAASPGEIPALLGL